MMHDVFCHPFPMHGGTVPFSAPARPCTAPLPPVVTVCGVRPDARGNVDLPIDMGVIKDYSGKADKKVPASVGNLAALDSTGNLADSGVRPADLSRVGHVHSQYLTEHQSLAGYATERWVGEQNYLKEHQSLAGYATEQWVKDRKYLTAHQSLAGYATETWVKGQKYLTAHQSLAGYATETWVKGRNYLTEHQDISGKADLVDGRVPLSQLPEIPSGSAEPYRLNTDGTVKDRAVNAVTATDGMRIPFPKAEPGYIRNFAVVLDAEGPVSVRWPGGVVLHVQTQHGAVDFTEGSWLVTFTEVSRDEFSVTVNPLSETAVTELYAEDVMDAASVTESADVAELAARAGITSDDCTLEDIYNKLKEGL